MHIECIDLRDARSREIARSIHSVQMAAYEQEARLLGFAEVRDFPPLQRSVESLITSNEQFFAAIEDSAIVGVISIEPPVADADAHDAPHWAGEPLPPNEAHIASLTVLPSHQRRGIALRLLAAACAAHKGVPITVSTSELNLPALALYAHASFVRLRTKRITWQAPTSAAPPTQYTLDLVLLRRSANTFDLHAHNARAR